MNINDYIKAYSSIQADDTNVTVTLCVPARKVVDLVSDECEESKFIRVFTSDVITYLESIGYSNISILQSAGTNNNHPNALTATWIFIANKTSSRKRRRTTKPKQTKKAEV